MDSSVPDIIFDKNQQCQYCKAHLKRIILEKDNYSDYPTYGCGIYYREYRFRI